MPSPLPPNNPYRVCEDDHAQYPDGQFHPTEDWEVEHHVNYCASLSNTDEFTCTKAVCDPLENPPSTHPRQSACSWSRSTGVCGESNRGGQMIEYSYGVEVGRSEYQCSCAMFSTEDCPTAHGCKLSGPAPLMPPSPPSPPLYPDCHHATAEELASPSLDRLYMLEFNALCAHIVTDHILCEQYANATGVTWGFTGTTGDGASAYAPAGCYYHNMNTGPQIKFNVHLRSIAKDNWYRHICVSHQNCPPPPSPPPSPPPPSPPQAERRARFLRRK